MWVSMGVCEWVWVWVCGCECKGVGVTEGSE